MFYFVFLILLSSTSIQFVDALVCADNCDYTGNIENVTLPSCKVVDKPATEHSCQVSLSIDYFTGSVIGRLTAKTPAAVPNFDALTIFSLSNEAATLRIQYDCTDSDRCDLVFTDNVLNSNWIPVQNHVKTVRNSLADKLINSSDLRSNDTCPSNQPCSGEGFCQMMLQLWSDATHPIYASTCANSTEEPFLEWVQALEQTRAGEVILYTCNQPGCAALSLAETLTLFLTGNYVLPFNVTVPQITTTTSAPTMSTATATFVSTTTFGPTTTTTTNAADSTFFGQFGKIIFAFVSFLFLYVF